MAHQKSFEEIADLARVYTYELNKRIEALGLSPIDFRIDARYAVRLACELIREYGNAQSDDKSRFLMQRKLYTEGISPYEGCILVTSHSVLPESIADQYYQDVQVFLHIRAG